MLSFGSALPPVSHFSCFYFYEKGGYRPLSRVKIAFFLLLVILLLSLFGCMAVNRVTDNLNLYLSAAQKQNQSEDIPALVQTLMELDGYFQSREWLLSLFLRREYVAAAAVALAPLQSYAAAGQKAECDAALRTARAQIDAARQVFLFFF